MFNTRYNSNVTHDKSGWSSVITQTQNNIEVPVLHKVATCNQPRSAIFTSWCLQNRWRRAGGCSITPGQRNPDTRSSLLLSYCLLFTYSLSSFTYHLDGLVVGKVFTSRVGGWGSNCSSHANDFEKEKVLLVATLPDVWPGGVRTRTCWSGVHIVWLDEMELLVCFFFLTVVACITVWEEKNVSTSRIIIFLIMITRRRKEEQDRLL